MMSNLHKIGFIIATLACLGSLVLVWNYRLAEGETVGCVDGFQRGNITGYQSGYDVGYDEGYSEGKIVGYRKGSEDGYNEGYSEGYSLGYPQGETDGISSGRAKGLSDGMLVWDKSQGYLKGIVEGAKDYTIRDPTYQEVLDFIRFDKTDQIPSTESPYILSYEGYYDHVSSFKKNAFEAGYRCFWVNIKFPDSSLTKLVAFNTTDKEVVFIDPETDKFVSFSIGKPYWDRTQYNVAFDDTVISYDLIP